MSRVKRVANRREMERSVDEFKTLGYVIKSKSQSSTRLKERDWGDAEAHLLIAVLTGWWSIGLANVLYALYKRVTAEEIVIRIDDGLEAEGIVETETTGETEEPAETESAAGDYTPSEDVNLTIPTGPSRAPIPNVSEVAMINEKLLFGFFQLFSLSVAGFVLLVIFAVQTGQIGLGYIFPTTITLTAAVLFRYVAVYHRFTKPPYRTVLLVPISIAVLISSVFTTRRFVGTVDLKDPSQIFQIGSFGFRLSGFLPDWWSAIILVSAGVLIFFGSVVARDFVPYPKPTEIRTTVISPVYFGFLCAFFGLWAVLFVGISIQRIVVIAPIFEELLKFGIALLIGSVLFGRSLLARIGVAAVVGSVFGIIEHSTTYPSEPASLHLFRTLFHTVTTVLSVSMYTFFESQNVNRLRWLAPAFSMLVHFFYNTFVVLSGLIIYAVFGSQITIIPLIYGGVAIFLLTVLIVLVLLRHRAIRLLYLPLESVLFRSTTARDDDFLT